MADLSKRQRRLSDGYSFAGFRAQAAVRGVFGAPDVVIVRLDRRLKERFAGAVGWRRRAGTRPALSAGPRPAECGVSGCPELEVRRVDCRRCEQRETRAPGFSGEQPRISPSALRSMSAAAASRRRFHDVARDLKLDWDTVKTLEQQVEETQQQYPRLPATRLRPARPSISSLRFSPCMLPPL